MARRHQDDRRDTQLPAAGAAAGGAPVLFEGPMSLVQKAAGLSARVRDYQGPT